MSWRHRARVAVLGTAITVAGITIIPGNGSVAHAAVAPLWPGFDIARGVAVSTDPSSGYILDGFGGVHAFSFDGATPPAVRTNGYWRGWDIARGISLRSDGQSGYTLDGFGGVHAFGPAGDMPPAITTVTSYFGGWDIARGMALRTDGQSGYILDGWGGLHPFGVAGDVPPAVRLSGYWQGWDIARAVVLRGDGQSGYVLDGFGGVHPFGPAGDVPPQLGVQWTSGGRDVARGMSLASDAGGYVVQLDGALHTVGSAPDVQQSGRLSAPARGVSFATGTDAGVVVDGFGAVYRVGNATSPSPTGTPTPSPTSSGTPTPTASATGTPTPTPTPTATPSPSPSPGGGSGVKAPLQGLLDRNGQPQAQFDSLLGGWIVNVHWSDVQSAPGAALNTASIDSAIAAVRKINAAGGHMGLKLRFFAGVWAPAWVKSLDGAPITLQDPQSGGTYTVGRWWTSQYAAAYDNVMAQLAAKYDGTPELREVVISRCTTVYAEPMIRQASISANRTALLAAGYSIPADQQCQQDSIQEHQVWQHTRSDISFNPFEEINPNGTMSIDENFTVAMMGYCQQVLGTRCGIENNSLSDPVKGGQYSSMYASMQQHAPQVTFQTDRPQGLGSFAGTLTEAVTYRASSVELPSGYETQPLSMLQLAAQQLAANPTN